MKGSKVGSPMAEYCSIERSLGALGERWTFLILREALDGATRFAQFRDVLGIAPDVLTDRLTTLVDVGVLRRVPYQDPGARVRDAYELTASGRELHVVLAALQQWGDKHLPCAVGPTIQQQTLDDNRPVHVGFVDERGREVELEKVAAVRTAAYPATPPALTKTTGLNPAAAGDNVSGLSRK
jgi:DNA-binding HxlR family transcriptional regulator